ncbi:MAG: hypothetical protein JWO70_4752 [Betaproteobacteria bacterium]|nr:hypothetical protein [Betaproteobacteria bacterium]
MLIRFDSKAGTITMFGDVAINLLRMMGQSGSVPGAILAKDIPPALERLRQSVSGERDPAAKPKADEDGEPKVGLRQRAFPLIELLERAAKQNADVIWECETRTAL